MSIHLGHDATILFQGDSITDAGRNRTPEAAAQPNHGPAMGHGYALFASAEINRRFVQAKPRCFNRGISGNKVYQLQERWQADCLDIKPDVLSILIGVNDYWHLVSGKYDGTPQIYLDDYDALLTQTRAQLPQVKLVMCQPFILPTGAVTERWHGEFPAYQSHAFALCNKHDAIWVPFHDLFHAELSRGVAPELMAHDGVHPTMAGHAMMARWWIEHVFGA